MNVKYTDFEVSKLTGSSRWWGWGRSADSRQTEAHCATRRGSWWHMERTDAFLTGWEKQTRLVPVMFGNGASFTRRVTPRRVCVRRRRAVSSRSSFCRSGLMVLGGFGDGNRSGSLLSGDSGLPLGRGRHHHTTIRPLLDKGATRGHTDWHRARARWRGNRGSLKQAQRHLKV